MEEDIEYRIKRFLDECEDGNWYWDDGVDAIETLIKGYRELEEKIKRYKRYLENKDKKFEEALEYEYQERETDYIPKSKIKEIFDRLNISDIEPWSTYKVNGQILFDLQELMEDK